MGCVSSNLLNHENEFSQLGGSALGHHIVKLTSSTYGLLTLDPPSSPPSSPPSHQNSPTKPPPQRFTFGSILSNPLTENSSEPLLNRSAPEVINSWELMSGLDAESFRFLPVPRSPVKTDFSGWFNKENSNPNMKIKPDPLDGEVLLERFDRLCPPNGENKVVIYTTSLRGVRRTFEACIAVKAAIESFGVAISERDVSMDRGFREELSNLMMKGRKEKNPASVLPPRVFVRGRYVGGAEEVLKIVEEGLFEKLIRGLPKKNGCGSACDGCGGAGFLPCFECMGSRKVVLGRRSSSVVMRCHDCNENGLVLCPICS